MAEGESPERLPVGWTEQVGHKDGEEVKFYYNVITGQKFNSKDELFHYVEMGRPSQGTRQQTRVQNEGNSENKLLLMPPPAETNKHPEWLPEGWIVELNATSVGRKYKRFIDPSTGRKFNSKPEIMRYLNAGGSSGNGSLSQQTAANFGSDSNPHTGESSGAATSLKPEGSQALKQTGRTSNQKPRSSGNSRQKNVEVLRFAAEGLPPGWIKEIKIERTGSKIRRDPFYTDPASGYVFRSQLDALRYLETNDISACATKARKREELKFLSDIPISDEKPSVNSQIEDCAQKEESHAAQPQTTEECAQKETVKECPTKDETPAPSSDQLPKTPGSKRKRGRPVSTPTMGKPAEPLGKKVSSSPCRSSIRIAGSKSEREANPSVQVTEAAGGDNGLGTENKGYNLVQRSSENVRLPSFSNCAS